MPDWGLILVEDDWKWKANPYKRCGVPEQWWVKGMREHFCGEQVYCGVHDEGQAGGLDSRGG
jgi:hypothetical protein